MVTCVVALSHSLALLIDVNTEKTNRQKMDDVSSSLYTVLIFIYTAVEYTMVSFIHPPIGEDGTDRCVPAVQRWCLGTG